MRTVSPAEFAQQIVELGASVQQSTEDAVEAAALQLTLEARKNITAATGGDSRLSGVGKRGNAKVGARYTIRRDNPENPTAIVSAEGPLQIVERDTKPHGEIPRSVGRLTARPDGVVDRSRAARHDAKQRLYEALFGVSGGFAGATPLSTPYGPRFRVSHPGTKGKHPFERAVDSQSPLLPSVFQNEIHRAVLKVFA